MPIYNPQMSIGEKSHSPGKRKTNNRSSNYGIFKDVRKDGTNLKYPKSVLNFEKPHPAVHPTQKSIELSEYLINTYTDEGMIVMDNTMGIGTACKGAKNTNRKYFGIEIRKHFFDYAKNEYQL